MDRGTNMDTKLESYYLDYLGKLGVTKERVQALIDELKKEEGINDSR